MNKDQQIRALLAVIAGHDCDTNLQLLSDVINWIVGKSRDGFVDFSIEDFAKVILDD